MSQRDLKELKEPLARLANAEDGVDGRFWQDRFRSHRLLDDAALLCCATYVDLNPVKAGMAEDPLQASHTSASLWVRRLLAALAEQEQRDSGSPAARDTGRNTGDDIERLLSACDDEQFLPAISARREPHLRDDAAPSDRHPATSVESGSAPETTVAEPATPTPGRAASRRASTSPLLRMTLGASLRRLRTIASSMVPAVRARTIARRRAQRSGAHASDVHPEDGPIDLQSILDGAATDASTFARAYGRLRFWGNAVGSTPRMAEEAIRRGVQRVVLALRDGVGAVPPTRTPSS